VACVCCQGGDEIIEALCKHSTTFEAKTEFAQEKYKRRKARKYLTRLTLRKPTGWTVCQVRQQLVASPVGEQGAPSTGCGSCAAGAPPMQGVGCGGCLWRTTQDVRAVLRQAVQLSHVQLASWPGFTPDCVAVCARR
jgi:coenzyme F420-reducing hydrogenase gamma subunit